MRVLAAQNAEPVPIRQEAPRGEHREAHGRCGSPSWWATRSPTGGPTTRSASVRGARSWPGRTCPRSPVPCGHARPIRARCHGGFATPVRPGEVGGPPAQRRPRRVNSAMVIATTLSVPARSSGHTFGPGRSLAKMLTIGPATLAKIWRGTGSSPAGGGLAVLHRPWARGQGRRCRRPAASTRGGVSRGRRGWPHHLPAAV